ncbi:MAG: amino acid ABC transporter permease [Streptococcaceae bacterium]|jgi:polar amino acid transport system permease protein|nr:amino acid ABC transporter permease [Streptococcaceae bacterium]
MKKGISYLIGGGVLLVVLAALILPFLIIPGKYDFTAFWSLFFTQIFNWSAFIGDFGPIASAIPVTLVIMLVSGILGLLFGLLLALIKINKVPILNPLRALFVSFVRGTPIYVQLFLVYTGFPLILNGINLNYGTNYNINAIPPLVLAIFAFTVNEMAYNSETIRAAIQSVDVGQIEAAKSLGMTDFQVFKRVTLPEAARVATAPLGNSLIGLLKGTSLAFAVSVVEMTAQAAIVSGSNYRQFEAYLAVALLYWPLSILMELLIRFIENRLEIRMPRNKGISGTLDPFRQPKAGDVKRSVNSDTARFEGR